MAKQASATMCSEEVEFVPCVGEQEEREETTENSAMEMNTQYVLEVEPVEEPRKKAKGKGKSSNQATMKKKITTHAFIKRLRIWIADTTLRIMKPWLKSINDESLKLKNQRMFHLGQNISQIMKQFFLHMKENERSLNECSFANFEEWCCGDALSMMCGRLQEMVWEEDLQEVLFNLYSDAIMELRRRQEELASESEEEQETRSTKRTITSKVSSLSPNMRNTSMSSTIVHTRDQHADACTSKDSESILSMTPNRKRAHGGSAHRSDVSTKGSLPSKSKRNVTFAESESDNEEYRPGQLYAQTQSKSVEEESEPELSEPLRKKSKKISKVRQSTDESQVSEVSEDEDFTSMVESLVRAHSLSPSTGKISQSILIKDGDGFLSLTSPGERGSMIVKLEMYPFKDCLRLEKNQFWTKRIFSSLAVVCSKTSPAYKTVMKLRKQLTKQVGEVKGTKIEKKAPTGWKRS